MIEFADDNLTFDMDYSIEKFKALAHEKILWCTPNGTMINKLTLNYTDYYTDISYGNLGYGFGLFDHKFSLSLAF